jgi:hypothetical protein
MSLYASAKHSNHTAYSSRALELISLRLQTDKPEGNDIIYVVNCMKCSLPLKYLTVNWSLRKWHMSCYSESYTLPVNLATIFTMNVQ